MPDIKVTYEITAGNLLVALGGVLSFIFVLQKVVPPCLQVVKFFGVLMAEHRLLVSDYAERHGIGTAEVADLALAEIEINAARRRKRHER